jgi:hypothetical protein
MMMFSKFFEGFGALYLQGLETFIHLWNHLALEVSIHQSSCSIFISIFFCWQNIAYHGQENKWIQHVLSNFASTIVVSTKFDLWMHYAKTWQIYLHRWLGLYFATMYFMNVVIKHISNVPYWSI